MRKKIGVLIAILIFTGIPLAVKATSENGNPNIKSYGSIIYKDSSGSVELYAEDIAFLQEKLASVPDEIFDPVLYSHVHEWEYINVNKNTHTRHCAVCGSLHVRTASPVDETHHQSVCNFCLIEEIQECVFDYDSFEDSENPTQIIKYCECGNYITEPKESVSENDIGNTEDRSDETSQTEQLESVSGNQTETIQGGKI